MISWRCNICEGQGTAETPNFGNTTISEAYLMVYSDHAEKFPKCSTIPHEVKDTYIDFLIRRIV